MTSGKRIFVAIFCALALLVATPAAAGDATEDMANATFPREVLDRVNASLGAGGRVATLEFLVFPTGANESEGNGGTANLGRLFAESVRAGLKIRGRALLHDALLADRLGKLLFTHRDFKDPERLKEFMTAEPPVDAVVSGYLHPTRDDWDRITGADVRITIISLRNGEVETQNLDTVNVRADADMGILAGNNEPPLYIVPPGRPRIPVTTRSEPGRLNPPSPQTRWLELLVDGAALPITERDGDETVVAQQGKTYSIRLTNHDPENDYAVGVLVDGLGVIQDWLPGGPEAADLLGVSLPSGQAKWVVKRGSSIIIPGWQNTQHTAQRFTFVKAADSVAAEKRYLDCAGVVTASFYRIIPEGEPVGKNVPAFGTGRAETIRHEVKFVDLRHEPTPRYTRTIHYR